MATNTTNLNIPLLQGNTIVSKSGINAGFQAVDNNATPKTHTEKAVHWEGWAAEAAFSLRDVIRLDEMYSWGFLECTTAGTTGTEQPTCPYGENDTVTDGTVVWTLRRIGSGSGGGVTVHNNLNGRSAENSHPIAAISGLTEALAGKMDEGDAYLKADTYSKTEVNTSLEGVDARLDPLEAASHTHANSAALAKLGETEDSKPAYDGQQLALESELHSHDNKETLDKFGEAGGNVTFDGTALVGGAQTWATNKDYQVNNLIVYNGLLLRCSTTHTSGTLFDGTKWEILDIGYIDKWAIGETYEPNVVVTRGNNILRCLTAHISYAWDNVQVNYWEIIGGKGANLVDWQPNTAYSMGEAVINSDNLYRCLADHTSSATFSADMSAGTEKWKAVGVAGSAGALKQATFLGVVAPSTKEIVIPWTDTFLTPPVEFLKFVAGAQDQVYTACSFDNGDADDFIIDSVSGELSPWFIFDGSMRPKTSFPVTFTTPATLGAGKFSESTDYIDHSAYKSVSSVTIN